MKKLVLSFVLFLAALQIFAMPASATFSSNGGQLLHVYFDGKLLNASAAPFVRTPMVKDGYHNVTLRIYAPNGSVGDYQTNVLLEGGFETNYYARKTGRRGFEFVKTDMVALAPPVPQPTPQPPHNGGGNGGHHGHGGNNGGGYGNNNGGGYGNNNGGYNNGGSYSNGNGGYHNTNGGGYGNNNNGGYNNSPNIMPAQTLQALQNSIQHESFDNTKLLIAQQALRGGYLVYTQDVKSIMNQFTFEKTRLEFAKFAYAYTYDRQNYFQVNDAFQFSSSIRDLNRFLEGR